MYDISLLLLVEFTYLNIVVNVCYIVINTTDCNVKIGLIHSYMSGLPTFLAHNKTDMYIQQRTFIGYSWISQHRTNRPIFFFLLLFFMHWPWSTCTVVNVNFIVTDLKLTDVIIGHWPCGSIVYYINMMLYGLLFWRFIWMQTCQ